MTNGKCIYCLLYCRLFRKHFFRAFTLKHTQTRWHCCGREYFHLIKNAFVLKVVYCVWLHAIVLVNMLVILFGYLHLSMLASINYGFLLYKDCKRLFCLCRRILIFIHLTEKSLLFAVHKRFVGMQLQFGSQKIHKPYPSVFCWLFTCVLVATMWIYQQKKTVEKSEIFKEKNIGK